MKVTTSLAIVCALIPQAALSAVLGERADFKAVLGTVDETCHNRFLSEAPVAWRQLQDGLRGFEVKLSYRSEFETGKKGPDAIKRTAHDWVYCVAAEPSRELADDGEYVSAINERYSFQVKDGAGSHVLLKCEPWEAGGEQPVFGRLNLTRGQFRSPARIWWVPLSFILETDGFKLVTAECSTKDGQEIVKIAYRYEGPLIQSPHCAPAAIYWAELSPADSWAVIRSGVDGLENGTLRTRTTTELQRFGDVPFPHRAVLAYEEGGRIVEFRETIFQSPQPLQRASEEFFLPFYGISESSVDILEPNRGWRIAMLVVGLFGVVASLVILRRTFGRKA